MNTPDKPMTFDEGLTFLRGLSLYESRVRITVGKSTFEGVVNETGVLKKQPCLRIEGVSKWFAVTKCKVKVL